MRRLVLVLCTAVLTTLAVACPSFCPSGHFKHSEPINTAQQNIAKCRVGSFASFGFAMRG